MLIEFGRKDTTFLPNTDVLGAVFCYFLKKCLPLWLWFLFLLKNIHTFVEVKCYNC